MPIVLPPRGLPAPVLVQLKAMGIKMIQGVEPHLRIGLLNLMPATARNATIEQFLGLIGPNSLNIMPVLMRFDKYVPKSGKEDMLAFYEPFSSFSSQGVDGLIVSGANLETDPEVKRILTPLEIFYHLEQRSVMDWAQTNVRSTIYSCHGAHFALEHLYGIPRTPLGTTTFNRACNELGTIRKTFGVFKHTVDHSACPELTRGMNDHIWAPQSRWGDVPVSALKDAPGLRVVAESEESGWQLLVGKDARDIHVQGHPEYYAGDLAGEYNRDKGKGLNPHLPTSYFPGDDDTKAPQVTWRSDGHVFYRNWVELLHAAKGHSSKL